ncbi:caa5e1df-d3d9-4c00-8a4f-5f2f830aabfd [Thermothielavioides terrestris]|uniref:Caa5e1df-d3d9-4c00-8a4f-5f2f830aabfd n=1 Tax=Thermothielavioides terrestris TaxID=2587410 RepID=A0A446BRD5_9PEZI|nr:caa5e1df-d3d9-4c00-8a4f-5f2f830aabfd [Thermothielavioides terrestris]
MWRKTHAQNPRRLALAAVAKETRAETPAIAAALPHLDPAKSEKLELETLPPLDPAKCPRFTLPGRSADLIFGTTMRVATKIVEADILERLRSLAASPENLESSTAARVAVLNMASDRNPGGGWLSGASAQEEALCFRSTLAASLHRNLYPIQRRAGLYTRDVVIFRTSMANEHKLLVPETTPAELPVVSVLSVAGIRRPSVKPAAEQTSDETAKGTSKVDEQEPENTSSSEPRHGKGKPFKGPLVFADPAARELTKDKMRLCLRMAAARGHTMLVLGALGCGAFRNPPREVAACWAEVLAETEFAGGWFKEIWFAVYDRRNEGNFEIFQEAFDGKVAGELRLCSVDSEVSV